MTQVTTSGRASVGAEGALRRFPAEFVFGAATAAYQIEGAALEGGRTDSIWDAFARVPGAIVGGDTGAVACDHYHRFKDDVRLMAELGLQGYRFSTSWSRVRPDGGPVNPEGLDFYSRLVDELLEHGIQPWLTLYHWDLPQAIEAQGGWAVRSTAERFADYALSVHDVLGDRVRAVSTLNEPWCSAFLGYVSGEHAPGRQDPAAGLAAAHHLLLAHGLAVGELRSRDPGLNFGITLNLTVVDPIDPDDDGDVEAARKIDGQFNRLFLDPLFRAEYPADVLADLAGSGLADVIHDGDLATISRPIDTLGVNYYHGDAVSAHPDPNPATSAAPTARPLKSPFVNDEGVHFQRRNLPVTSMQWEVQPEGLTRLLRRVNDEYTAAAGVALVITENGSAYDDEVEPDGSVVDTERVTYLIDHLAATLDAIDDGVRVGGYFAWSLLDNFEWAWGYGKRFGIVRVDYDTQLRTPKQSARILQQIIHDRALPPAR